MRQALHIFLKDVRYLRYEIVLILLIVSAFAFTGSRRALAFTEPGANQGIAWGLLMFLLPLAWWILIARVIHAETLPGDRQFWLTRPYAWKSLLGAKALFILIFVNLSMLFADAVIIRAYGFAISGEIPGLLWTQVLLSAAIVLPAAAISAITTGLLQLVLIMLAFSLSVTVWSIAPVLHLGAAWMELDWIKLSYALMVITAASLLILIWEYARRKTSGTRAIAGAAALLVLLGISFIPWTTAFAIQSHLSHERIEDSSIRVGLDSDKMWAARALVETGDQVRIELPLQIAGIPSGMEMKPDGLTLTIQAPHADSWRADQRPWANLNSESNATSIDTTVPAVFYEQVKNKPATLRGSLFFTLYGNRRATHIPFRNRPVAVPRVGLCSAGHGTGIENGVFICSSAFQPQRYMVFVEFIKSVQNTVRPVTTSLRRQLLSYSPFPADLSLDPVNQFFSFTLERGPFSGVMVETLEPLAHIRRDFEIRDLHLSNFEVQVTPIQ